MAERTPEQLQADSELHCAQLRAAASELIEGRVTLGPTALAQIGRQLHDYASLLEHADRENWWDR